MFSGQREFRAVMFSVAKFDQSKDVLKCLAQDVRSDQLTAIEVSDKNVSIHHGFFYSSQVCAPPDVLKEVEVTIGRTKKYSYDFYVIRWKPKRTPSFIVAVPFGRIAEEMFGMLEHELGAKQRLYKHLDLQLLVDLLAESNSPLKNIESKAVRFLVTGGDTVKTAHLTGPNVARSKYYERTKKGLRGIKMKPRRVRFRFENGPAKFTLEADRHGNFWFPVSKEGGNLCWMAAAFEALATNGILSDTKGYPLREGLRTEDRDE